MHLRWEMSEHWGRSPASRRVLHSAHLAASWPPLWVLLWPPPSLGWGIRLAEPPGRAELSPWVGGGVVSTGGTCPAVCCEGPPHPHPMQAHGEGSSPWGVQVPVAKHCGGSPRGHDCVTEAGESFCEGKGHVGERAGRELPGVGDLSPSWGGLSHPVPLQLGPRVDLS